MATFTLTVVLLFAGMALLMVALAASANHVGARGFVLAGAVCLGLAVWGVSDMARAQSGGHHPHHRDFYHHWKQPGVTPQKSCCNARVLQNGREVGDCEPTFAKIVDGQWQAWLPQENRWHLIPDAKIIRERNPSGQDAHHCWAPASGTLCFVPPDVGG